MCPLNSANIRAYHRPHKAYRRIPVTRRTRALPTGQVRPVEASKPESTIPPLREAGTSGAKPSIGSAAVSIIPGAAHCRLRFFANLDNRGCPFRRLAAPATQWGAGPLLRSLASFRLVGEVCRCGRAPARGASF
ncbi:hypothetical protein IG631_09984 [Alternaria alternata]|nr:hypothetical protein IG631_09984 [Alternaria alternata]